MNLEGISSAAILEAMGDPVAVMDLDHRILFQNRAHERLIGRGVGEICSAAVRCVSPECDACPMDRAFRDGGSHTSERTVRTIRGELKMEVTASVLRDANGTIVAGIEVLHDVTARHDAMELRERLLRVESEERKRAEDGLRVRDDFLAIATHELKTPFSALRYQLQGMLRAVGRATSLNLTAEHVAGQLEIANRQAEKMARLVDNLLHTSCISAGEIRLKIETVDLANLACDAVERLSIEMKHAGCALRLHAGGEVYCACDRTLVEQVLTNLISNAMKYGLAAPIDLYIEANERHAIVRVVDHGKGVSFEEKERIFDRFARGHVGGVSLRKCGIGIAGLQEKASPCQSMYGPNSLSFSPAFPQTDTRFCPQVGSRRPHESETYNVLTLH
jgi:PAS domain S-box-containing protein